MACIQPCLGKLGIDLGFYIENEIWPRKNKEKSKALFFYKNLFSFICQSEFVSYNKAIEELKQKG